MIFETLFPSIQGQTGHLSPVRPKPEQPRRQARKNPRTTVVADAARGRTEDGHERSPDPCISTATARYGFRELCANARNWRVIHERAK